MAGRYASNTDVSPDRSRGEIERTLSRYGARSFMYGWDDGQRQAVLAFVAHGRQVRFVLPMPDRQAREFTHTPAKERPRSPVDAEKAYEQAVRQSWRALALCIKAKLEAVEASIVSFEDEFLAHFVLPDGNTVSQHIQPRIAEAYANNDVPALLPDYGAKQLTVGRS